jgi:UDP-N-acetylglucosamine 2-epimerase (non-hydrolysing)
MAAAMAAYHRGVDIAHIEAGLRSGNLQSPFPEEGNRRTIGALATYHFAPTPLARENLLGEGVDEDAIFVTGNTVLDTLREVVARDDLKLPEELEEKDYVLITLHRRENLRRFDEILAGIGAVASKYPKLTFAWPVHPNPLVRAGAEALLDTTPNALLLPPLDYGTFVRTMQEARLILTDSGGIQEEAPSLGVPVLVIRDETERTEGLRAGAATLVGTNARGIMQATSQMLDAAPDLHDITDPLYGDGDAATRIVEHLLPTGAPRKRPPFDSRGSDLTNS